MQSLEKKVEVEKKVVQAMPGIHTMQNLNEYLRALQEHGVNQVCRDMMYRVCGAIVVTRLQNFAKGLTDGCFMEGFMRMKRVPGRCAFTLQRRALSLCR